jgi:hypothetical protein
MQVFLVLRAQGLAGNDLHSLSVCRYCVVASGLLIYAHCPLLNNLVKKTVCIFSIRGLTLYFKNKTMKIITIRFFLIKHDNDLSYTHDPLHNRDAHRRHKANK